MYKYGWQVSRRQEPKIVQTLFVHQRDIFLAAPAANILTECKRNDFSMAFQLIQELKGSPFL